MKVKVKELIEQLQKLDPDKEVRFPDIYQGFELSIDGISEGEQGDWYVVC